jgi:DNA-binding PadR family transcriptional regulator
MEMKLTNAELAILSLIAEQPRHGYEIEGVIEARGMRDWTEIGFSSIYYLLNKLEKDGLVASQLTASRGRGPARKVYRITPEGERVHLQSILAALSIPSSGPKPFLMGLFNLPTVPREQLITALSSYAAQLEDGLVQMHGRAEQQQPLPPFVEAMFDYSRVLAEAELNWVLGFIQEVEAGRV